MNVNKVPEKYIELFLDLSKKPKQLELITSQIQNTFHFYEKISRKINSDNIDTFFALIVSTKECSEFIKIKYGSEFFDEIKYLAESELNKLKKIQDEIDHSDHNSSLNRSEITDIQIAQKDDNILEENTPPEDRDNNWNYYN
jgi:hypothetical protein